MSAATRDRILRVATNLLADGGRTAVSTRSVSAAAGVQPPTIYRLFGDMDGLLDAVAAQAFADYLADKRGIGDSGDPVADLRRSWDLHVEFGLARPAFYTLVYGNAAEGKASSLRLEAEEGLRGLLARVAGTGQLRMSVERAAALMHAGGVGVVLSQLLLPPAERDPQLPVLARESVLRTVIADRPAVPGGQGVPGKAVALRVAIREQKPAALSRAERSLLDEWLGKLADSDPAGPS